MKKIFKLLLTSTSLLAFASCGISKTDDAAKKETISETKPEEEHLNVNTASLSAEQMKTIGIQYGTIEQKQLTSSVKANGFLKVPNNNKANATSLYGGVIISLLIQEGNFVRKGQAIATIANPQFIQMQEEYLTASSKITLAEQEYLRQKKLNSGNAGALKNLQNADAELKTLLTRKASLYRQILLMGIDPNKVSNSTLTTSLIVTSPISGTVSNIMAKIGSYVDVSAPVAEIVDNGQLHLDLQVYEKDLPKLKVGQTIHFTLTNNPGQEYDADIYSIGTAFANDSKTIPLHATVKGNKIGLIDGMNITANISLEKAKVPAVPTEAIVNFQGQDYIFILSDKHSEEEHPKPGEPKADSADQHHHKEIDKGEQKGVIFERIPVAKGTTDVGYSEITLLKEIRANAKIVIKGAFFILAKMTNSSKE